MTTNTVKHTPTDRVADDLLRNGYDRWLRLEEEKAAIGDDLKELFAELKAQGFTPKALRESFRRVRNADNADQQEHDAIVDLYVASLTRARPARTREASYSEAKGRGDAVGKTDAIPFDPETGEITDNQEQPDDDDRCYYCADRAPAGEYYRCPKCDAEWPPEAETDDVGATASSTYSHSHRTPARADMVEASTEKQAAGASRPTPSNSQASPLKPADSAGEAPSSSQASPATHSDDIDLTIPDFLRRTEGGYPKREAVEA